MATTSQHIAARGDSDLLNRLIAMAEIKGVPNAQGWVQLNMGTLISTPVKDDGSTDTIASVYDYAKGQYDAAVAALPPTPGENPAAVTDDYLGHVVEVLLTPDEPPANQG